MIVKSTNGYNIIIDYIDYGKINYCNWNVVCKEGRYYAQNPKGIGIHRIITECPDDYEVDHINHDCLDNRRVNLRIVNKSQNAMNRRKLKNCSSIFKGVCYRPKRNKFQSYIKLNGKFIHLGMFDNEFLAAICYDGAAKELFGEHALLNF